MKGLRKVLIPLMTLIFAMSLVFAVACNDDVDTGNESYTVTFDLNYEGAPTAETAETVDGKVAEPTEPERADYTFDGWYTAAEGGEAFDFDTVLTADTTLYAHWTENAETPVEYTVTFDLNYENAPTAPTAQTVEEGGKVAEPTVEREDYILDGWFTEAEGGKQWNFDTDTVSADITLYAHWSPDSTVCPPEPDDEPVVKESLEINITQLVTDKVLSATTYTEETALASSPNGFVTASVLADSTNTVAVDDNSKSLDGYSFKQRLKLGGAGSDTARSIKLTIKGEATVTVYMMSSNGSDSRQVGLFSDFADTSATQTVPGDKIAKYEYTVEAAGTYYLASVEGGVNIYLVKVEPVLTQYTVTFNLNGGDGTAPTAQKIEEGGKATAPAVPEREGYTFLGWYDAEVDGNEWDFDVDVVVRDVTLYAYWEADEQGGGDDQPKEYFTVTYMVDGEAYTTQKVESGKTTSAPTLPAKSGYMALGWFEDNASAAFDFSKPITSNLTLTARYEALDVQLIEWGAYNESLYVIWQEGAPQNAVVEYQRVGVTAIWTKVDAPLIRATSADEARVDIVGLMAGTYNVRITTGGKTLNVSNINVTAYDRSGYAHFNYSDGVGAYKDDGTLKDGALVIYVTEENKNNVLDSAYVNGEKVDISEYMVAKSAAAGVTVGQQTGIGELLNNRRYSGSDRMNVGIAKLSQVYGAVVVRIIGTVSAEISGTMESSINGLTDYDSTGNGGSEKDNGRMARITNANDLTIEGVGDDASIFGWGVHFIASDVLHNYERAGESFEVRNITFQNYPEDAIGMEGVQGSKWDENGSVTSGASSTSADLLSPVQRCWIHNNTFLPGYAVNPAESDKAEGDGSCDFKRGMYYTLSYNYFEGCHKTNLIGSSDSSLQFNITIHHNWWNQCGSRIPLVRNSNLHFYNNYVSGDMSATPKPELSYVVSARGSAYMFSEANYFDGCKNIVKEGTVKSYNDVLYADFGTNVANVVTNRDAYVSNSCKFEYRSIDYSHFDTNPELFYYKDGKSDCLLDDAVTARQKAMMYAGANGHGVSDVNATSMNKYTPDSAVSVTEEGLAINLPTVKGDSQVSGVLFNGITGVSSGTIKYKGQGITFTLTAQAQLTVTTTTTGEAAPELVGADGRVYAHKFEGTLTIVLEPGTYFIASGQKDKEVNISSMRFDDTSVSSAARVEAAVDAIEALPDTAALTDDFAAALRAAQNAYGALTASEKTQFNSNHAELVDKLNTVAAAYSALQVQHVRELIEAIGTVDENSYGAINAAQSAYDALTSDQKAELTDEKAVLDAAWSEFEQYQVLNVINLIEAFTDKVQGVNESTDRATIEALIAEGETVQAAYNALSSDEEGGDSQQSQVTNYDKLTAAIAVLEQINKLYEFKDALEYFDGHTVTIDDGARIGELQRLYEALSETQKGKLTSNETALYDSAIEAYNEIASQAIESSFDGADGTPSNPVFSVSGNSAKNSTYHINGLGGKDFTRGLKMESQTTVTFTTTATMTLTLYVDAAKNINIDGNKIAASQNADGDYVVVITLDAGTHTITKADSMNLWYATLMPAA